MWRGFMGSVDKFPSLRDQEFPISIVMHSTSIICFCYSQNALQTKDEERSPEEADRGPQQTFDEGHVGQPTRSVHPINHHQRHHERQQPIRSPGHTKSSSAPLRLLIRQTTTAFEVLNHRRHGGQVFKPIAPSRVAPAAQIHGYNDRAQHSDHNCGLRTKRLLNSDPLKPQDNEACAKARETPDE